MRYAIVKGRAGAGFTLVEFLVTVAVMGALAAALVPVVTAVRARALEAEAANNIRRLAEANLACVAETGRYVQAANLRNTVHWHGRKERGVFTGRDGYLSPYLENGRVRVCPVFEGAADEWGTNQFNKGTGGFGYNMRYLGGSPHRAGETFFWWTEPNTPANVPRPATTVMFTSTAIASGDGLAEYGFSEPYRHIAADGLGGQATPSVHFRYGHVSFEEPNDAATGWNAYGDDNDRYRLGWFGPQDLNGYWNPRRLQGEPF